MVKKKKRRTRRKKTQRGGACFVLWRHSQFHLTVFSSVFLSCAVQFVQ